MKKESERKAAGGNGGGARRVEEPATEKLAVVRVEAQQMPMPTRAGSEFFQPVVSIEEAIRRYQAVKEFVSRILVDGVDYAIVPGAAKKSLMKPGAEKMCSFFGFQVHEQLQESVEDWTGMEHGGEPFFYYRYKVQLLRGGAVVAEGEGSANSWEKKYRYRNADRLCPKCGKPAIKRSKFPPRENPHAEPGWYCFNKAGGCGANFAANDAEITGQQCGQIKNPDVADVVNTLQKMSQKRALVAPVLIATNTSEYFTQDIEDFDHEPPAAAHGFDPTAPDSAAGDDAKVRAAAQARHDLKKEMAGAFTASAERAKAQGQAAGQPAPPASAPGGATTKPADAFGRLCAQAGELKAAVGDDAYYHVLGGFGVKHANQLSIGRLAEFVANLVSLKNNLAQDAKVRGQYLECVSKAVKIIGADRVNYYVGAAGAEKAEELATPELKKVVMAMAEEVKAANGRRVAPPKDDKRQELVNLPY